MSDGVLVPDPWGLWAVAPAAENGTEVDQVMFEVFVAMLGYAQVIPEY